MKRKLPKIKHRPSKEVFITSTFFSNLKRQYKMKEEQLLTEQAPLIKFDFEKELEEKDAQISNQKQLSDLYCKNFASVFESLKEDLKEIENDQETPEKKDANKQKKLYQINNNEGYDQFNKTKNISPDCMIEFYKKYSKYDSLCRYYPKKKNTPSWSFIESSTKEKIIPNPLGLLRRSGQEKKIILSNHKVGDTYMKVLSNSLKYSQNLNGLEFSGNRLSSYGTSKLFKSLNFNKELCYNIRAIDLSGNKIGNNNIDDLVEFIKGPKCSLENLNIYGNNLSDKNIIKICESICSNISFHLNSLNIGKNNIHDESINSICQLVNSCSNLKNLNLGHNWLHNQNAARIIKELATNSELKVLDLSWNCLGDDLISLPTYEQLVNRELNHPERLFNNFSMNEALYTNKLNLRNNPLLPKIDTNANNKNDKNKDKKDEKAPANTEVVFKEPKKIKEKPKDPSSFALALGELFEKNVTGLLHLDISYNNLNYSDCKLIAEKSKINHSILGLHIEGNLMDINCLGFITPKEKEAKNNDTKYFAYSHINYELNRSYDLRKTKIDSMRKIRGKNNCWICEGYREIQFEYVPEEPIPDPSNHLVKLHLDFDDYKPFDMIYNGTKYQIVRMCPPGEVKYFFTVDTKPVKRESPKGNNKFFEIKNKKDYIKLTFDNEYMEELNNIREKLLYEQEGEEDSQESANNANKESKNNAPNNSNNNNDLNTNMNKETTAEEKESILNTQNEQDTKMFNITMLPEKDISITVDTISKINVKVNKNVINEEYRKMITFCEPRPDKILNKFVKPRTPWVFPNSIWAYYDYEYNDVNEAYLDKCFEFDFNRCQFNKEFKDEDILLKLKNYLRGRYRNIVDCYRYYASIGGYQVPQITQNSLSDFIYKCPNLCDKNYDINNVYLQQKVVVGNLVDKEDKKKKNKNLSENNIVRHQFMNLLVKTAKDKYVTVLKTTTHTFEAVTMAFEQHYDPVLKTFEYHKWRKERYYNEKIDNFMKSFLPLLDALFLSWAKQKGPTKKDVWMDLDEFNSLVQNIVDINEYPIRDNPFVFNQSMKLQINEIYSDKHLNMMLPEFLEALCRTIDKASPIPLDENKEDWPWEKRQAQPLINKLENIMPILIKLITGPEFKNLKEKFPIPLKDLSTGLYTPNYENNFYLGYVIKSGTKKGNMRGRASISTSLNPNDNLGRRKESLILDLIKKNEEIKSQTTGDNIKDNGEKKEEKTVTSLDNKIADNNNAKIE